LNADGIFRMGASSFADLDTTPDDSGGSYFFVTNSGATTITSFDSGTAGQVLILRFTDGNTTINEAGNIDLSAAFTSSVGDILMFIYDGGTTTWYEVSRSVN